jgi:hypothetical protein
VPCLHPRLRSGTWLMLDALSDQCGEGTDDFPAVSPIMSPVAAAQMASTCLTPWRLVSSGFAPGKLTCRVHERVRIDCGAGVRCIVHTLFDGPCRICNSIHWLCRRRAGSSRSCIAAARGVCRTARGVVLNASAIGSPAGAGVAIGRDDLRASQNTHSHKHNASGTIDTVVPPAA